MKRSVHRFIAPILAIALTAGAMTALAQKSSSKSSAKSKEKVVSKYHRLPTYYGQLKLKEEQGQEIYALKEEFGQQIDELQEQLAELKEQQAEEIKDVLTRTQVTALNKLVAAGSATNSKASKAKSSSSRKSSSKKKSSTKK
jgi:cytochrome c-type biogenesis protein CcmH/NrfG